MYLLGQLSRVILGIITTVLVYALLLVITGQKKNDIYISFTNLTVSMTLNISSAKRHDNIHDNIHGNIHNHISDNVYDNLR